MVILRLADVNGTISRIRRRSYRRRSRSAWPSPKWRGGIPRRWTPRVVHPGARPSSVRPLPLRYRLAPWTAIRSVLSGPLPSARPERQDRQQYCRLGGSSPSLRACSNIAGPSGPSMCSDRRTGTAPWSLYAPALSGDAEMPFASHHCLAVDGGRRHGERLQCLDDPRHVGHQEFDGDACGGIRWAARGSGSGGWTRRLRVSWA